MNGYKLGHELKHELEAELEHRRERKRGHRGSGLRRRLDLPHSHADEVVNSYADVVATGGRSDIGPIESKGGHSCNT